MSVTLIENQLVEMIRGRGSVPLVMAADQTRTTIGALERLLREINEKYQRKVFVKIDDSLHLAPEIDLLDSARILESSRHRSAIETFRLVARVESTNKAMGDIRVEPRRIAVCVAESQSKGRGRRGRVWHSAPYQNLMFSVKWQLSKCPPRYNGTRSCNCLEGSAAVQYTLRCSGIPEVAE